VFILILSYVFLILNG